MTRIRVRFTKEGKVRFTSHRDVARIWERALRRAQIPVAHSEGFSPRPRIAFGLALSTGSASRTEYIDVVLDAHRPLGRPLEELPQILTAALPEGIDVTGVATLTDGAVSLQQAVTACTWEIMLTDITIAEAQRRADRLSSAAEIVVTRERKGKPVTDDLRPAIRSLEVDAAPDGSVVLIAEVGTQPRALRPAELLAAFQPPLEASSTRRLHQWIESEGARMEPLEADTLDVVDLAARAAPVPRTSECVT